MSATLEVSLDRVLGTFWVSSWALGVPKIRINIADERDRPTRSGVEVAFAKYQGHCPGDEDLSYYPSANCYIEIRLDRYRHACGSSNISTSTRPTKKIQSRMSQHRKNVVARQAVCASRNKHLIEFNPHPCRGAFSSFFHLSQLPILRKIDRHEHEIAETFHRMAWHLLEFLNIPGISS